MEVSPTPILAVSLGEWVALAALILTILGGAGGAVWRLGNRLGTLQHLLADLVAASQETKAEIHLLRQEKNAAHDQLWSAHRNHETRIDSHDRDIEGLKAGRHEHGLRLEALERK